MYRLLRSTANLSVHVDHCIRPREVQPDLHRTADRGSITIELRLHIVIARDGFDLVGGDVVRLEIDDPTRGLIRPIEIERAGTPFPRLDEMQERQLAIVLAIDVPLPLGSADHVADLLLERDAVGRALGEERLELRCGEIADRLIEPLRQLRFLADPLELLLRALELLDRAG